jgi:hypothetical protein
MTNVSSRLHWVGGPSEDTKPPEFPSSNWVTQNLTPLVVQGRVYAKVTAIRSLDKTGPHMLKAWTKEGDVRLTRVFRDMLNQEQEFRYKPDPFRFPPPIDFKPDARLWCHWFLPDATDPDDVLVQVVCAPLPLVLRHLPEYGYYLL